jgi:DNA-binding CsgD family transcriptional regulator
VHKPAGSSGPSRLLERASHVAALNQHLGAVDRVSGGRLVLIGGEAGVGKTALVRHFCAEQARSLRILSGSCDALFTPRPLGPFLDIAHILGDQFADLAERGGRPYEIAAALMRELRSGPPTILVLEDLHWADEATLDVVRLIARRMDTFPALVVASYRDDELDRVHPLRVLLGELPSGETITRMRLDRLSLAAVTELAQSYAVDAEDLHHKTAGNAFFVTEALAAGDVGIPPTVRDAVLTRAARLRPGAMALLQAVAIVPPLAEPWLLEGLAPDALEHLDECLASGMLTPIADGVGFRHELARLAIEDSLTPVSRVVHHRRALHVLAAPRAAPTDLARLAHHAEAAADTAAVLHYAPAAGAQAAAMGAHREAAAQYARAVRFAGELPPGDRAELLERQSQECYLSDQLDLSVTIAQAAVDAYHAAGDPVREGDAMRIMSSHMWCLARIGESEKVAIESVALLEQHSPTRELAMAYSAVASLSMNADDAAGTTTFGERALVLAEKSDNVESLVHALNALGTMEMLAGDPHGRRKLERSLELARTAGLEEHVGLAYLNMVWAAGRTRTHAAIEQALREGLEYCSERGLLIWRRYLVAFQARMALDRGQWSEAVDLASDLLRDPRVQNPRVPGLIVQGLVRARRGDPEVWPPLDRALQRADQSGELQFIGPVAAARAEAAWLEGNLDAVRPATAAALELARQRQAAWVVGELACWRWRAGVDEPIVDGVAEPYALEMSGQWRQAADFWAGRGCPYESALALASAPEQDALRQALDELQRLGARPAAGIVARRLRELGARGLPRGPRVGTRANAAQLTARQLEILELLTQGLRNAEIAERLYLSARTVDHHVSAILDKLGARTRTEATRQAAELGIQPAPRS